MAPDYAYNDTSGDLYLKVGSKLFRIPQNPLLQESTVLGDKLRPNGTLIATSENSPFDLKSLGGEPIKEDVFAYLIDFLYKGVNSADTKLKCIEILDLCITLDMPDVEDRASARLKSLLGNTPEPSGLLDLYETSIGELQAGLEGKKFTSVDLVQAYFARIEEVNKKGPNLNAVIETNTNATALAKALDDERKTKGSRGPLHGIPIMLKDNIATQKSDGLNTTAGAKALEGRFPPRDATIAAKLRAAGAIFLGKANQSEWSYHRDDLMPNAYSERGGQCTSPYVKGGDPIGSSSGSAVCTAIGLAAASIGTETFGSIVSPSSRNNIVGIKPTVGLTSRAGVIPISSHQDSPGPMTQTVEDVAIILSTIAGLDSRDDFSLAQPTIVPDYMKALDKTALKGKKLGIPRKFLIKDQNVLNTFNEAIRILEERGAKVEYTDEGPDLKDIPAKNTVLSVDFKIDANKYLAELKDPKMRSINDVVKFNYLNRSPLGYGQDILIDSAASSADDAYFQALQLNIDLGRKRGIDAMLSKGAFDALILPSESDWKLSSFAGYPIISVPLGFQPDSVQVKRSPQITPPNPLVKEAPGFPFGIAFTGPRFSEGLLLGLAYDFEQTLRSKKDLKLGRLGRKAYPEAIPKSQLKGV